MPQILPPLRSLAIWLLLTTTALAQSVPVPAPGVPQAPVLLIDRPSGRVVGYGKGATTATAVGTALLAAQTAAASGDLIELHADATISSRLGKNGVTLHVPSATITATGSEIDLISDGGSAMTFTVTGAGTFVGDDEGEVVFASHASTVLNISGYRFAGNSDANACVMATSGTINISAIEDIVTKTAGGYDAILTEPSGGTVNAVCRKIIAGSDGEGIEVNGGTINVTCQSITAGQATEVSAISGTINVHCPTLDRSTDIATSGGTVNVFTSNALSLAGTTPTAFGLSLIDDAASSNARTTLGVVIGTNVQAFDVDLSALAGLTSAADKGIQFTGSGTAAVYDLTTAGKALLDDASASVQRTTLDVAKYTIMLGSHAGQNPGDAATLYPVVNGLATDSTQAMRVYPIYAGTITAARVIFYTQGTLGTTETSTLTLRKNGADAETLTAAVDLSARIFTVENTSLTTAVAAGDYLELKWVTPTWATNPTTVLVQVQLTITR